MSPIPASLQSQLVQLGRGLRAVRAAAGLALWVAAWALVISSLFLILRFADLPLSAHTWLQYALIVFGGASFVVLVLGPAVWPVSSHYLAQLVERRFPDFEDQLLAAVRPAGRPWGPDQSPLYAALAARVGERLRDKNLYRALDFGRLRKLALVSAACLVTAAVISYASGQGLSELLSGPQMASIEPPAPAAKPQSADQSQPPVTISEVCVELDAPEYSGLGRRRVREDFQQLQVLAGTKVRVSAQVSGAREARLERDGGRAAMLRADGGTVRHRFAAVEETTWQLSAGSGDRLASIGPYDISVFRDRPPQVQISRPGKNLELKQLRPVELAIEASDDFGLGRVALLYRRRGAETWESVELGGGQRTVSAAYEWDLEPMNLAGGEAVEYRAIARDNDSFRGPKTTASDTYLVSLRELRPQPDQPQAVQQAQQAEQDAVMKLHEQAQQFDEQLKSLLEEAMSAAGDGQAAGISKGLLQEAQRKLQQRADDVREAMRGVEQSLDESPLVTEEMVRKVHELHDLMSELMNEDLKRVMDKLRDALENLDTDRFMMDLQEARQAQQQFMEKLDRTIELLRKAKLEASLQALQRFLEDLADRQDALREKTEQLPDGVRPESEMRDQGRLAEQAQPVAERVRELGDEMDAQDTEIAARLRNLAGDLDANNPAGQMRDAVARMDERRPSEAIEYQRGASRALRDAAGRLAKAAADLTAQQRDMLTRAANSLARDALKLSQQQEDTIDRTRPVADRTQANVLTEKQHLSAIQRRQQVVRQGTESLTSRLQRLAGQTAVVPPEIARRTGHLAGLMAQVERQLAAGDVGTAFGAQKQTMAQLNRLSKDLMELAEELNKQSAQMALQQYLKRLEQLAQQQRQLNAKTQMHGQQGKQGAQGQPMPGAGSQAQLALEQAMIREALQRILQGAQGGKLSDQLGNVPAEMEKVEDDLQGGTVTPRTIESQREILHKMLDAQRSLYSKRKESKRRKAEKPQEYEKPASPPVLRPAQTEPPAIRRRQRDLGAEQLPLDFESITREYLQRIRQQ